MYIETSQCIFRDTRARARRGQYDLTRMVRTIRLEGCPILQGLHSRVSSLQETSLPESHPAISIRPWSSLLIRDYRLIFITILCANTSNNMRNVASLYQVYQLSCSSVQLGLAGFFQALPFIIFGLFGGVLADTWNRKKVDRDHPRAQHPARLGPRNPHAE